MEPDLIKKVYVEPTNRCNLTCRTCQRHAWNEEFGFMETELFARLIAEVGTLQPPPSVFFGGYGEPLFHPGILAMVGAARAAGLFTELITNGIMLDEKMASGLIASGLDRLWVSLDGASAESYADVRLGDHFPEIVANLGRLRDLKKKTGGGSPEFGISFVAMRRNGGELPRLLELAKKLGAGMFSLSNVEPYQDSLQSEILFGKVFGSRFEPGKLLLPRHDPEPQLAELFGLAARSYPGISPVAAPENGQAGRCPFHARRSVAVRWDGRVSPCLPLLHSHDVFMNNYPRYWPAFDFGSLRDSPLLEIWEKSAFSEFRSKLERFAFSPCAICNSCDLPSVNGEDCFGNSHPACGGCLWSQGFVQCP